MIFFQMAADDASLLGYVAMHTLYGSCGTRYLVAGTSTRYQGTWYQVQQSILQHGCGLPPTGIFCMLTYRQTPVFIFFVWYYIPYRYMHTGIFFLSFFLIISQPSYQIVTTGTGTWYQYQVPCERSCASIHMYIGLVLYHICIRTQ